MRTGKCRLNAYLYGISAAETELCDCGELETVEHFIVHCRRWQAHRVELRTKADKRWGDLSYLLGGWSNARPDDTKANWKPD